MANIQATAGIKSANIEMTILRAVPCSLHAEWTPGCPNCLTGEQAHEQGLARTHKLGVVSSSSKVWNLIGRRLSERRINKANRGVA